MSKNNRKERKVNTLSNLSTVVDRETLPVADQSPAETGAPEIAETIITTDATEAVAIHEVRTESVDGMLDETAINVSDQGEPVTAAVAEQIAESSTVEEAAAAFDVATAEPPAEPQPDHIDPPPAETEKVEEPVAAKEIPKAALELIEALQAQINLLKTSKASRKVASGSKARPNVTYTLLAKPPAWHSTPQVAQLQQILFNEAFLAAHRGEDGTVNVSEPELFAQVIAGKEAGVLRTHQEAVRIFQYYRSILLNSNCLRWQ
jgi:hypothetical protein